MTKQCITGAPVNPSTRALHANVTSAFHNLQTDVDVTSSSSTSTTEGTLTPGSQHSESNRMADALGVLSVGSLAQINSGEQVESMVLQCVQIKPMASQQGQERYRVVMNDSVHFIQCMLAQRE